MMRSDSRCDQESGHRHTSRVRSAVPWCMRASQPETRDVRSSVGEAGSRDPPGDVALRAIFVDPQLHRFSDVDDEPQPICTRKKADRAPMTRLWLLTERLKCHVQFDVHHLFLM